MENTSANELKAVLKGEEMAIESYQTFISNLKDSEAKNVMQSIQDNHKKNAEKLFDHINELGGDAKHGTGIGGAFANTILSIQNLGTDTLDIVKKAYDGEDQGIGKVEEIIKGDLDAQSSELVNNILSVDHDHLKQLKSLINNYGSGETNNLQ